MLLRRVDMRRVCVSRGVVEVVALLGFIQRGLDSAAVARFGRSLIKSGGDQG